MNRISIAICDDDKDFLQQISGIINDFFAEAGIPYSMDSFGSGEEILNQGKALSKYSILFLDILMDGMSGISTAKKLRALGATGFIVFISGIIEAAPDGYEVSAFRYILKNQFLEENLKKCLQTLMEKHLRQEKVFSDRKYNEKFTVELKDILYFESQLRKTVLYYYRQDQALIYEFYGKISDLERQYEKNGFLRVHKGYLVNLQHVEKLERAFIFLTNGKAIPVSPQRYNDVKKSYLLWRAGYKDDYQRINEYHNLPF